MVFHQRSLSHTSLINFLLCNVPVQLKNVSKFVDETPIVELDYKADDKPKHEDAAAPMQIPTTAASIDKQKNATDDKPKQDDAHATAVPDSSNEVNFCIKIALIINYGIIPNPTLKLKYHLKKHLGNINN